MLDGEPFQIRSGELHYNRIPQIYWRDRMEKCLALGLNTVCTYVFWNEHEREPGEWDFSGNRDLRAFVQLAQELGLWVLLRPGPYVCSEWDWGGLPYWLANIPGMAIRQLNEPFLQATENYMAKVAEQTADLTIERGGPILMVQVENEYGSFGNDHVYMGAIRDIVRRVGFDGTLFTSDGPTPEMLAGGTLPDIVAVVNFGSRPEERFKVFEEFRPCAPKMCGELWFGWFDHWGVPHHVTDLEQQAKDLEWFMETGASFNIYMVHGGTNWGFMNGANWTPDGYRPDTTSYDYDAAIAEDGRLTPKYFAFRDVVARKVGNLPDPPPELPRIELPDLEFASSCPLESVAVEVGEGWRSMEEVGVGHGAILYRIQLPGPGRGMLRLEGLQDFAAVVSMGRVQATLDRRLGEFEAPVEHDGAIDLYVENSGRINYAREMLAERKGVVGATLDGARLENVAVFRLDFQAAKFSPGGSRAVPALYRSEFRLDALGDACLDMSGWGKGNVWVNGFNLGRHWSIGPQRSLFCPANCLRTGMNEVVVLELLSRLG